MADLRPWKCVSSAEKFANPFWRYCLDRVQLPDGREWEYHFARTPGSVMVVPILPTPETTPPTLPPASRMVMVRQFRYLMNAVCLEFPAGGIKPGATAADTARLELREEIGHDARDWQFVGHFNPCKGLLDERCHVFIARDLFAHPSPPDATESFEIVTLSIAEFETKIRAGEIADGMTLAAWMLAQHHLRE